MKQHSCGVDDGMEQAVLCLLGETLGCFLNFFWTSPQCDGFPGCLHQQGLRKTGMLL